MTDPQTSLEKPTLDKDLDKLGMIERGTQFVLMRGAAPGLALIFLAGSAVFAAMSVSFSPESVVIVAAAAIAAYMAMNIGANDVTNNVGAAVGARAISLAGALILAAFFEIAGAMFAGGYVVNTIKSSILVADAITSASQIMVLMISALLAAAIWINIATWTNAPVSTTHSIVGGIVGGGLATAGPAAVRWPVMSEIAFSWLLSPIFGAVVAVGFLWLIKETIIYREDKIAGACRWVPILLALMLGSFLIFLLLIAAARIPDLQPIHAIGIGLFFAFASYFAFRDMVARQARELENRNQSLKILFRVPLVFSAALMSFAHGANDVANAVGPLSAIVEANGIQTVASNLDAPFWVMTIGALGISTGLLLYGPRLIRIVGSQITKLNPFRAYCVAMASAITVIIASVLGMPVSSTHVVVGAVFGVGLFREWYTANSAKRRLYIEAKGDLDFEDAMVSRTTIAAAPSESQRYRYLVRRSYLLSIVAAWVITVPVSAALAAGFVFVLQNFIA